MIQARVNVTNIRPLMSALSALRMPELRTVLDRALLQSAFLVQRIASTEKIRHGSRRSPPLPDKLTSRNAGAGLVGSIGVDRSRLPFVVTVGSALRYAPVHELGGVFRVPTHRRRTKSGKATSVRAHSATFPKRPFLAPALEDASKRFPDLFVAEVDRAVGSAR